MTFSKRMFDLAVLCILMVPAIAVSCATGLVLLCVQGRPVLFGSERMIAPGRGFVMWKFRTMTTGATGVTGGHVALRITPLGHLLRRSHLDELPQLWNILRGEMSFVGPRPPLRRIVERCPELYADVLRSRPGLTGLASLRFGAHEARLLAGCASAAESEEVYLRRCARRKARLDLIHLRNRSLRFDAVILVQTLAGPLRKTPGLARAVRRCVSVFRLRCQKRNQRIGDVSRPKAMTVNQKRGESSDDPDVTG
jgi:lipopolysaccharide/colanic/teichoic acid biosynthesis glycosyltransferase